MWYLRWLSSWLARCCGSSLRNTVFAGKLYSNILCCLRNTAAQIILCRRLCCLLSSICCLPLRLGCTHFALSWYSSLCIRWILPPNLCFLFLFLWGLGFYGSPHFLFCVNRDLIINCLQIDWCLHLGYRIISTQ